MKLVVANDANTRTNESSSSLSASIALIDAFKYEEEAKIEVSRSVASVVASPDGSIIAAVEIDGNITVVARDKIKGDLRIAGALEVQGKIIAMP